MHQKGKIGGEGDKISRKKTGEALAGGGPFDVIGDPFMVLEILEKILDLGIFFPKF